MRIIFNQSMLNIDKNNIHKNLFIKFYLINILISYTIYNNNIVINTSMELISSTTYSTYVFIILIYSNLCIKFTNSF